MAFIARRNFGPFAIAAVPVISRHLQPAFEQWMARLKGQSKLARFWSNSFNKDLGTIQHPLPVRLRVIINTSLIVILGLTFLIKLNWVSDPEMIQKAMDDSNSAGAVSWLKSNKPSGNLLNEYNTGGYLVWALRYYPVFIDGRTDMYGSRVLGDWIHLVQADPGWETLLSQYKIGVVMVDPGRPLVGSLQQKGWQKTYEDSKAVILVPGR
jgi:hypothetical protein